METERQPRRLGGTGRAAAPRQLRAVSGARSAVEREQAACFTATRRAGTRSRSIRTTTITGPRKCAACCRTRSRVTVPTLMVAGYFDAEDFYGPLELYHKYETQDPKHLVRLVIGPWYHGEWSRSPDGRTIGAIDFGQDTSRWYRDNVQARWFAHWLKGQGLARSSARARVSNRRESLGALRRVAAAGSGIEERQLYLRAGGKLSFEAPVRGARRHERRRASTMIMFPIPPSPCPTCRGPSPMTTGPSGRSRISASSMAVRTC